MEKIIARQLDFSLAFFAQILLTTEDNLQFAIIKRVFADGGVLLHPGIVAQNLPKYVFDIAEGVFVPKNQPGRDKLFVYSPAEVEDVSGGCQFSSGDEKLTYLRRDFIRRYKNRVVNSLLLH